MRTTIVPAQVTTVEDRVIGNMNGMQSVLLIVATICATATYIFLPPYMSYNSYKLFPMVCIASVCGLLAIKIRRRVVLAWIVVMGRYMLRPKYYTYDKRSTYLRDVAVGSPRKKRNEIKQDIKTLPKIVPQANVPIYETVAIEEFVANPQTNLHIKSDRKGRISVHFNEI